MTLMTTRLNVNPSGNIVDDFGQPFILALAGSTTNDAAAAGNLGELIVSLIPVGSAVALTTATPANVASISLTAGDWDVRGNINFTSTSATMTAGSGGTTSTSATVPTDGTEVYDGVVATTTTLKSSITPHQKRFSLATTTTIYLVASKTFSAGSVSAFGSISARRVR